MLEKKINGFVAYCKVSRFKDNSIEFLYLRLKQFNHFIKNCRIKRIRSIQYRQLRRFVADYKQPSIHVKKARIWSLRVFYHFLNSTAMWMITSNSVDTLGIQGEFRGHLT